MAAVLARSGHAASPEFLTPLDVTENIFGRQSTWTDDGRESSSDGDDEQVMQHLRAARERLLSLRDDPMCAMDEGLELPITRSRSPAPRERAQSQPNPSQPATLDNSAQPARRSLTLELASVPFHAFIDTERRRLNEGRTTPVSYTVPSIATPTSLDMSGLRFGLAPYTNLERDEWLWTTEGCSPRDTGSEDSSYSPTAHEVSQHASQAQEAWTWAMSGPPAEHCEITT